MYSFSTPLDPQAREFFPQSWSAPLMLYDGQDAGYSSMNDHISVVYPFNHEYDPSYYSPNPYCIPASCCYEQQTLNWAGSRWPIYQDNMLVYMGSSPIELQSTHYFASPQPGNFYELPFSPQISAIAEDQKARGKMSKKDLKSRRKNGPVNSYWVGKGSECGSGGRRCPLPPSAAAMDIVKEGKTTLMVKNIPNKYTRAMLLKFLDQHCDDETSKADSAGVKEDNFFSAYDFVYLPIDFITGCNLGYAFVNFTGERAALGFYQALNNRKWDILGSKKVAEISIARIQGKEALEDHFQKSVFLCNSEEFLPILFSPYRHGKCEYQSKTIGKRVPRIKSI